IRVVREHHAMADEDVVLDRDAFTHERVRRNLAAAPDRGAFLDFDESADLRAGADVAAVETHEIAVEDDDPLFEDHAVGNGHSECDYFSPWFLVPGTWSVLGPWSVPGPWSAI